MSTHPTPETGSSQSDLILDRLRRAGVGGWVPMPELARVSGAYAVHSRIADLRRRGHRIAQKNEHQLVGGRRVCLSRYALTQDADPPQLGLL